MSLPVHLVPSLAGVAVGGEVTVEGDEAHHAVAVRRLRVGESVVLTDGAGTSVTGAVGSTGKRVFAVTVESRTSVGPAEPSIVVVQAVPKGDRGELAVEVLTEVGVATIVPWSASRSVAVWKGERVEKSLARWRSTAREAAKQARRSWFPEVADLASTSDVVDLVGQADLAVVLHEEASVPLASFEVPDSGRIVVVVGPEGGLSPDEIDAFVAAGAVAVRLGAEVLRTSTAGLAAVAALLSRTSRWG
ncbi:MULTISPECIES: 16S rRNA (uracil(1498)-N(3))-methyltransferase [unclassified Nocardioides]|uniref:16S rRNA (uracil(1498)-N(3))-methyltransferase n=1 Tax=unclassified Nocardioides TaxID=2615069 RepID=UPI0009F077FB|nr:MULTISPECIES: 16S rRNA (uracil(1498)-N(3))-methyltransferase [unclassified Nocardioides]GAW49945.1 16S ribosomal RNA methyltransferase RsmE [Nocardioides sp. PD653-B2]GAW55962.1 16S ribosomal RNA methyltransferase RsmE [Nocardioides sp. PD653]